MDRLNASTNEQVRIAGSAPGHNTQLAGHQSPRLQNIEPCSICLEPKASRQHQAQLQFPCGHSTHLHCIKLLIDHKVAQRFAEPENDNPEPITCPECRADLEADANPVSAYATVKKTAIELMYNTSQIQPVIDDWSKQLRHCEPKQIALFSGPTGYIRDNFWHQSDNLYAVCEHLNASRNCTISLSDVLFNIDTMNNKPISVADQKVLASVCTNLENLYSLIDKALPFAPVEDSDHQLSEGLFVKVRKESFIRLAKSLTPMSKQIFDQINRILPTFNRMGT